MPVIINDYVWKQTTNEVIIQIPLRGVPQSKVDVFTSPRYIKATFEQKFFEAVLLFAVDVSTSKCTITEVSIIFELKKNEEHIWETLEPNISKKEKMEIKNQLLNDEFIRLQNEKNEKANKKAELKRVAVREQIEIDTKTREQIEGIKKQEESNALGNVNEWSSIASSKTKKMEKNKVSIKRSIKDQVDKKPDEIVPLPRAMKTLQIDFTPREFPTPSRESKLEEENEWLKKQAEARRSCGFVSEDIRPEERNPQFLKAKGDEFFKNKNYLGAISAYSFGIKLSQKFVDLYISRSEVHMALGNYNKAIQDCSTALDLLKPEVLLNLNERALCIGRRGEALFKFGMVKEGIEEIKISLKLKPDEYFRVILEEAEQKYDDV